MLNELAPPVFGKWKNSANLFFLIPTFLAHFIPVFGAIFIS